MKDVFLLLGTNLGNRLENLKRTIRIINSSIGEVHSYSSIYETSAWGMEDQPDFLNMIIQISTDLSPEDLLKKTKELESQIGRIKTVKWGPREIDIDILFYNDLILKSDDLVIPHPGIPERKFTLIPLQEIAPDLLHPISDKTPGILLGETKDQTTVTLFLSANEIKDQILLPDDESS